MSTLFEVEPEPPEVDLPAIEGTVKQIPWATAVRKKKIQEVRQLLREWAQYIQRLEDGARDDKADHEREALQHARTECEALEQRTAARWWLDRRENTARELLAGAEAKPGGSW